MCMHVKNACLFFLSFCIGHVANIRCNKVNRMYKSRACIIYRSVRRNFWIGQTFRRSRRQIIGRYLTFAFYIRLPTLQVEFHMDIERQTELEFLLSSKEQWELSRSQRLSRHLPSIYRTSIRINSDGHIRCLSIPLLAGINLNWWIEEPCSLKTSHFSNKGIQILYKFNLLFPKPSTLQMLQNYTDFAPPLDYKSIDICLSIERDVFQRSKWISC